MGWRLWLAPGAAWGLTAIVVGAGASPRAGDIAMGAATLVTLAALYATGSRLPRSEWDRRRRRRRGPSRRGYAAPGRWGQRPDGLADPGDDTTPGMDEGDDPVDEVIDVDERLAPYDGRVLRIPELEPQADPRCTAPLRKPSRDDSQLELWPAQDQRPALIDLRDISDAGAR